MLTLDIPGRESLSLHHLVLDFNGTIAFNGELIPGVHKRIQKLSKKLAIYVITADTNGNVINECKQLPVSVHIIGDNDQNSEKREFVHQLDPKGTACLGNGMNDEGMFLASDLAMAIVGREGCATSTLIKSDIVVPHSNDALDLLLNKNQITATLRN